MSAILIVEGHDEAALVNKLIELHRLVGIKVVNAAGNGSIRNKFHTALLGASVTTAVTAIAILRDAEEDPARCKAELDGYAAQVKESINPNIAFEYLMLPSESSVGSLETMCLMLIPPADDLLACADQFLQCAAASPSNQLSTKARQDKARYLIRQFAVSGKPQGLKSLIESDLIELNSDIFNPIVELLQRLSNTATT